MRTHQPRLRLVSLGLALAVLTGCASGPGSPPSVPGGAPPGNSAGGGSPAAPSSGVPSPSGSIPVEITPSLARAQLSRRPVPPDQAALAAEAITSVGLRLLDRLPDAPNVVLSPASIVLALAMVRPGARGETAAQMDAVLGSLATNEHAAWLNALDAALATRSGRYPDGSGTPRQVTLRLANAAFGQRGLAFQPAYLAVLAEDFGAGLRLVDYQSDPDGARQTINGWVDQATEGRISQLLAPGAVDPLTRLVLVNALYFAAPWLVPFPAAASGPAPFRLANGETVEVPTMHLQGDLRYSAQGGWQALELPYVGGSLALTLVLPPDQGATGLSQATLDGLLAGLGQRSVRLALPRFTVETRANLVEPLTALGISLLFDPQRADLSGISAQEQLYVTTVAHQARIRVDEAGTEAAAATAVVVGTTALPADEVEVRVDRPFWFVLRDLPTGAVLFLGRVGDPRAG